MAHSPLWGSGRDDLKGAHWANLSELKPALLLNFWAAIYLPSLSFDTTDPSVNWGWEISVDSRLGTFLEGSGLRHGHEHGQGHGHRHRHRHRHRHGHEHGHMDTDIDEDMHTDMDMLIDTDVGMDMDFRHGHGHLNFSRIFLSLILTHTKKNINIQYCTPLDPHQ